MYFIQWLVERSGELEVFLRVGDGLKGGFSVCVCVGGWDAGSWLSQGKEWRNVGLTWRTEMTLQLRGCCISKTKSSVWT